jgi:class 3 adenylate cyclase/tetratricopeptide (TPR) repeat protein/energy-coupling factor transporter ATP-binding protein EcfA2
MSRVGDWLERQGLGTYADAFAANSIDWPLLARLTIDDLRELGLNIGERRRFLEAAATLGVRGVEANAATSTPALDGDAERRQLTVMFCDLVGSTDLSGQLDPEELREVMRAYQKTAEEVIQVFGGHIAQCLGDGLLVYFGYPLAHEDDAQRAVHAGVGILQAMTALNTRLDAKHSVRLSVRVGIHTGPVVVGQVGGVHRNENLAVGETPNLAARLQALAEPNAVVISDSTRRLLGEVFMLVPLGEQRLKGLVGPVQAFLVTGERLAETRFAARQAAGVAAMVGRQQELALLLERWRQAKAGEGQMVVLAGEAGIGKSRIVSALLETLVPEEYLRISYQCSPYHTDTALYPAIQQLTFASRFTVNESPVARLDKLEALLRQAQDDISTAAPLVGALLGLGEVAEARHGVLDCTPKQRRARTLQVMLEQFTGSAGKKPVLFVLEDAHWIDPTTLELIELSLERIGTHRILLLITARPTFADGFGGHPIVSRLALNRLGREHITGIVERITRGKRLPPALMDEIAAKTDGVPLFVEEFTKALLESGQLHETEHGYEVDARLHRLTIPSSLHDSLMARLDRMQPIKEVAQEAACIGREFGYSLLAAVSPLSEGELAAALEKLVAAELVFRRGVPPDSTYTFKHALVRDAAYESLLKARRQTIHDGLLNHLEASGGAAPEVLAHHATEAGRASEAVDYWRQAGDEAVGRPAFIEAISHFQRAAQCVRALGESVVNKSRELDLLVRLSHAALAFHGYAHPTNVEAITAARALLDAVGETPHRFPVLYGNWVVNHVRGEHVAALGVAEDMCLQAERDGIRVHRLNAYRVRGASRTVMGDFLAAEPDLEHALALHRPDLDGSLAWEYGNDPAESVRYYLAISLLCCGEALRAWGLVAGVEDAARERGHLHTYANALSHLGWISQIGRTPDRDRLFRLYGRVADSYGFRYHKANALCYGAVQLHEEARHAEAADQMSVGLRLMRESHTGLFGSYLHAAYASSLAALGRLDEAVAAERTARDYGSDHWAAAEVHRLLADSHYWHQGDAAKAIDGLRRAMAVAEKQGARLWELRAAVSLARIQVDQGQRARASDLLSPFVERFPVGGGDLADMVAARTLLQQEA